MIPVTIDPISHLDALINEGLDVWEAAVSIGQSTEESLTVLRWVQGDVSSRVDTVYGENSLSKYAAAINVNTNTLKQRKVISEYYPRETRTMFPSLGFSHYRTSMKLGDLEKSLRALEKAELRQYPVFKFDLLIKRLMGKRRNSDSVTGEITRHYGQQDGEYIIVRVPKDNNFTTGQTVVIKAKGE